MTNYDWLKTLKPEEMANVLGEFIDHDHVCSDQTGVSECVGCPIRKAGHCKWPDFGCDISALDWLLAELGE